MSFYNPYMSHPDYGQGVNDFIQQMFQMMMYRKYMDALGQDEYGQGQQEEPGYSANPNPQGFMQTMWDKSDFSGTPNYFQSSPAPQTLGGGHFSGSNPLPEPLPTEDRSWQIGQGVLPMPGSLGTWDEERLRQLMQFIPGLNR